MKRNRWDIFPQELFQGLKVILSITFGGIALFSAGGVVVRLARLEGRGEGGASAEPFNYEYRFCNYGGWARLKQRPPQKPIIAQLWRGQTFPLPHEIASSFFIGKKLVNNKQQ